MDARGLPSTVHSGASASLGILRKSPVYLLKVCEGLLWAADRYRPMQSQGVLTGDDFVTLAAESVRSVFIEPFRSSTFRNSFVHAHISVGGCGQSVEALIFCGNARDMLACSEL